MSKSILKIKKTQLEMMRDRGYDISNEEEVLNYTLDEFNEKYNFSGMPTFNTLSMDYYNLSTNNRAYVHYFDTLNTKNDMDKNIKDTQIKELNAIIINKLSTNMDTIVLISEIPINKKEMEKLQDMPSFNFQLFLHEDLINNKTKHNMVPKHILLNLNESIDYLKSSKLRRRNLPKLCMDDPIVKYYGAIPGQIFKIIRGAPDIPTMIYESIEYKEVSYKSIFFINKK